MAPTSFLSGAMIQDLKTAELGQELYGRQMMGNGTCKRSTQKKIQEIFDAELYRMNQALSLALRAGRPLARPSSRGYKAKTVEFPEKNMHGQNQGLLKIRLRTSQQKLDNGLLNEHIRTLESFQSMESMPRYAGLQGTLKQKGTKEPEKKQEKWATLFRTFRITIAPVKFNY